MFELYMRVGHTVSVTRLYEVKQAHLEGVEGTYSPRGGKMCKSVPFCCPFLLP